MHVANGVYNRFPHVAAQHLASYGWKDTENLRGRYIPFLSPDPRAERSVVAILEHVRHVPALQAKPVGTDIAGPSTPSSFGET